MFHFSPKKYAIQVKDIFKGLYMAITTAAATMLQKAADVALHGTQPAFPVWKLVVMSAIGAALAYIGRKYFVDDVKIAEKTIAENPPTDDQS